jgi:putative DNA primase/helicase
VAEDPFEDLRRDAARQFEALRQAVHLTSRDDYFATMLAQPGPLGLGDKVRFDHSTGLWHIWNKVRWAPDRTTEVFELIRERLVNIWLPDHNINPSPDSMKVYSSLLDAGKKMSVLKMLASMPGIAMSGEEWDQDPELMGFRNGVLNLRTLVLDTNPSPDLLISRSTGVDWDPNADVAPFLKFVDDIMSNDPDMTEYLLRVLGYSMLGTNREQKFWMWVGTGQNGKGVLARVAASALGDYAATPPDTLYMRTKYGTASSDKPRPELLKLQGARFTYMSEPQGGQFNEEMLKAHSGNDFIEARTLYAKTFKTFQPTHKIVFLTNNPPRTEDVGPSMQRRVRLIWFEQDYRDPARDDKGLEERLKEPANLQGALLLMAGAASDYLAMGLPEPQKVTNWSRAYIEENDPISAFVVEMCVNDPDALESSGQMFKAFDGWCDRAGVEKMSVTGFGLAMARRYTRKARSSGNFYEGIRLKNATDRTEEGEG